MDGLMSNSLNGWPAILDSCLDSLIRRYLPEKSFTFEAARL